MRKLFALFLLSCFLHINAGNVIDLSGEWSVALDKEGYGEARGYENRSFDNLIRLPGTTDEAGYGDPDTLKYELTKPQLLHLTRKYSYMGPAWYTREISVPETMNGKRFILSLERVIWSSDVWIDGEKVTGTGSSLSTPHIFDLTSKIKPGKKQRLTIRIDNRKKFDTSVQELAHAYTDHTQTIWNGITGEISIGVYDKVVIDDLRVEPDIKNNSVKVDVTLSDFSGMKKDRSGLSLTIADKKTGEVIYRESKTVNPGTLSFEFICNPGRKLQLWSEFNPVLYTVKAELKSKNNNSTKETQFGMRQISTDGTSMRMNGMPVFLRGTLECCIFPLTGYPPATHHEWERILGIAKQWGLNHLRFHSWCPPKAAFEVADEMGFYLQVELPVWSLTIGKEKATEEYMYKEADRIIKEYGNHPSFCFFCMGNELQGDITVIENLVGYLKAKDRRHLYTNTAFTFEKGYGTAPVGNDDFLITQWTDNGWVRGQGVFNSESPCFDKDYSTATRNLNVPLITHEIGQYAVYPDMKEIPKYTGVLDPVNFKSIKRDLENKGMSGDAGKFTEASGKLAAILYKEEIERAMKTPGVSGFQLLDLHDFPGQGTALVGLLNAFWESKGVIDAQGFRQFCSPVVPLARFAKATYSANENFEAQIDMSNYSDTDLMRVNISWSVSDDDNRRIASGSINSDIKIGYNHDVAKVSVPLSPITNACKLTFEVSIDGTAYRNRWNIWVYPENIDIEKGQVIITKDVEEALKMLRQGNTVLLNPDWRNIKGVEGKFVPVFWSPVHFPKQAGTMGLLCDPLHPALKYFPTDGHTDWQWWDLLINSTSINTEDFDGGRSVVSIIDNFANNRKLSLIYEAKVFNGKLLLAGCDLTAGTGSRIVAGQMLNSILKYMNSNEFNPSQLKNPDILRDAINADNKGLKKDKADSMY